MYWFLLVLSTVNIVTFGFVSCVFFRDTQMKGPSDLAILIICTLITISNMCGLLHQINWLGGTVWPASVYLVTWILLFLIIVSGLMTGLKNRTEKVLASLLTILALGNVVGSIFS